MTMTPDADWAEVMRAATGLDETTATPEQVLDDPGADWHTMTTAWGGSIDWAVVEARDAQNGKRLLVVELDDEAEARVFDALEALTGQREAVRQP